MFRPPYDDHFKASALEMLYAAGYPSQRGALIGASRAVGVPVATLRRWVIASSGETSSLAHLTGSGPLSPEPSPRGRGAQEVLRDSPLPDAIRAELLSTLTSMAAARSDATYKELSAGFAVLAEKLRLLEPPPEGPPDMTGGEARERLARLVGVADPQGDS